jgi:hypothetical protein
LHVILQRSNQHLPDLYYLQTSAKEDSGLAADEELIKAEKTIEEATL